FTLMNRIVARILAEVKGVNRVLYDFTPKPCGTIEWE
ncbi:MAG: glutamine-hydrolyzing GMP synthase subunit GuaA, partial [Clostridiales bacterium]|nr:glutamine-hydrolyzing GMP synthase subunit GuaA [Candidatus Coliplasma caballi]